MTDTLDNMKDAEEIELEVIDPEVEKQKENMQEHLLDEFSDSALFNIVRGKDLEHKLWTNSVLLMDKVMEYSDSEAAEIIGAKDRSFVNNRRRYFENIISPITYENENGTSYRYSYKSVFVLKMIQVLTDGEPKMYQPAKLRDALAGKLGTVSTPREKQPIDQLYEMIGNLERKFDSIAKVQQQQALQMNQVLAFKKEFTELFMQVGLIQQGEDGKLLPSEKFEGLNDEVIRELAASAEGVDMRTLIQDMKQVSVEVAKDQAYKLYLETISEKNSDDEKTKAKEELEALYEHRSEIASDIRAYIQSRYKKEHDVETVNQQEPQQKKKGFGARIKAAIDAFKG